MNMLIEANRLVNRFIWGVPAMACILGVGLYLSIRTGFLQLRNFPEAMQVTIGRIFRKREAKDGALTPFRRFAPPWRPPLEQEILPVWREPSVSAVPELSFGCGCPQF